MPRGPTVYSLPPGTTPQIPNTVIPSATFNAAMDDIATTFNTAQPIVFGGTGGTSVITGWDGLATAGTDVASSGTINLTTATGPLINITGVTTIGTVTLADGALRIARATGVFRMTASSTLVVNGSTTASYTTNVNDLLLFRGFAGSVSVWVISTPQYGLVPYPPGTLYGLTLTNNSGTPNDKIDMALGAARDGADSANMDYAAAITAKDITVAWAVGSSAGLLDTGAVSNTTYYLWGIKRPDTGVTDLLGSLSSTAPTMPTNYTIKVLLGSFTRYSGVNDYPSSTAVSGKWERIGLSKKATGAQPISFTSISNTLYSGYMLRGDGITLNTDAHNLLVQVSNAASFVTSGYSDASWRYTTAAASGGSGSTTDAGLPMNSTSETLGTGAGRSFAFECWFGDCAQTSYPKSANWQSRGFMASGTFLSVNGGGQETGVTAAVDGFRITSDSTGIATGRFELWGMRR